MHLKDCSVKNKKKKWKNKYLLEVLVPLRPQMEKEKEDEVKRKAQ